jgi:hypothetical protein
MELRVLEAMKLILVLIEWCGVTADTFMYGSTAECQTTECRTTQCQTTQCRMLLKRPNVELFECQTKIELTTPNLT